MIDLDQVVLQRAAEQVQAVRFLAGDGVGRCACGKPLRRPARTGAKPVTCGRRVCILARKRARQHLASRRSS